MPFQQDYILRQIEMMTLFYERILDWLTGDREDLALEYVEETALRQTGQKLDHLLLMEADDLLRLFGDDDRGRGFAVSAIEVLCARAEIYARELDEEKAIRCWLAALEIAVRIEADDHMKVFEAQLMRMRKLERMTLPYLDEAGLGRLYDWYIGGGRWAEAENLLEGFSDEAARERARRLYDSLEAMADSELEAGGFSRPEIEEGRIRYGLSLA